MVQSYTSDCYAPGNVADTDLVNMENNFNTLRSSFAGTGQPSNPVQMQLWGDTTTAALKMRNVANSSWQTIWDLTNERAPLANKCSRSVNTTGGISGGGALTTDLTISHGSHEGDVSGSSSLSISTGAVGGEKIDPNVVRVYEWTTELRHHNASWNTEGLAKIFIVPADGGFLRMYSRGRRSNNARWRTRLRVGGKNSSGTGNQLNENYTTNWIDAGSVSLSTFTASEPVLLKLQMYCGGGGDDTGFCKENIVVYGSST